jgi:hypothetical protein
VQNFKRPPGRPPFEEFITFAGIKLSGLVDTRQRRFERHTTLNHQTKKGVLNIVITVTHGISFHDQKIAIKHCINMKYNLTSLGIIYITIVYVILQFF